MQSHLSWLLQLTNATFGRRRFVRLSPWTPRSKDGHYYDKHSGTRIRVHVRSAADQGTADQIFCHEDYAFHKLARFPELKARFDSMLEAGISPLAIDCGANIGLAAKYMSREFPGITILCVEPDENNLVAAKQNNLGDPNLHFIRAAVGSKRGRARIANEGAASNAFQVEAGMGDIDIYSIPDLLAYASRHKTNCCPFIVKLDVEGSEASVFSGDVSWIDAVPILIVELHDWMLPRRAVSRNFLKAIAGRDRDFVIVGENVFSIRN